MTFCSNCDSEAVCTMLHPPEPPPAQGRVATPLCQSCRTAYEWGQANPDSRVADLDGDELLDDGYTDATGNCYSDADSGL